MTQLLRRTAIGLVGLLCGLFAEPAVGQSSALELLDGSRFWIRGTSTVNTFSCTVDSVRGDGALPTGSSDVSTAAERAEGAASLTVPVQQFDCGRTQMTEDLKETLRADEHPTIRFRLHEVEDTVPPDRADGWHRVAALGYLTVSGTERLVRVTAEGRPVEEGIYRLRGCKPIRMTYFGVEPPTKFMGVIKVDDRIEVHFDLLATAASQEPSTLQIADSSLTIPTDSPACDE